MMVETILESSQDFSMSNGVLPQWKRELLQRRAARARPAPPPALPPAPPPPPPLAEDEELRYGPGIVKRLKSRYLSLALRDAPRRRPSVLRRAASLEHLLDSPPAPRPPRPPRPASLAAPLPPPARRDAVKRARSVDALSRLDSREDPPPSPPPPPPAPRPPPARSARPPRRAQPLLSEAERPPPDLVRSTLRKFESPGGRRAAPAARVAAVLRGLERSSTPEPGARPTSPADVSAIEAPAAARLVSRAALDGIARAGSSVRYSFSAPRQASHLPPLSATNPVLLGRARASSSPRRVGVIRPMPAPALDRSPPATPTDDKCPEPEPRGERRESPPSALVEPIPRLPLEPPPLDDTCEPPRRSPTPDLMKPMKPELIIADEPPLKPELPVKPEPPQRRETVVKLEPVAVRSPEPVLNGHAPADVDKPAKVSSVVSVLGGAGIERAWNGSGAAGERAARGPGAGAGRGVRGATQHSTSVVFNFSNRKEVPDYIENDGLILRASKRDKIKAGDPGVVVLNPDALEPDGGASDDERDCGPPSPCGVRFFNDNVLINGRSSMRVQHVPRLAALKLQFDDSLTRTFEYPSETSLCEERAPSPPSSPRPAAAPAPELAEPSVHAPLASNTHIASAALCRYTPHHTDTELFQLGVTRHTAPAPIPAPEPACVPAEACGAAAAGARWSDARADTDLLF